MRARPRPLRRRRVLELRHARPDVREQLRAALPRQRSARWNRAAPLTPRRDSARSRADGPIQRAPRWRACARRGADARASCALAAREKAVKSSALGSSRWPELSPTPPQVLAMRPSGTSNEPRLPPADASSVADEAERIYLDFASACGDRAPSELRHAFDALCAAHPEQASKLRRLRQLESAVEHMLEGGPGFFRPENTPAPNAAQSGAGIAHNFKPGETIGDFELVRLLGHGGMGQVWEARQISMRRRVALKFILPGRAHEHMVALFEREARAGGRANHPNLVRTLARGSTDGIEWIAQELVEGSFSLRDAIERFRREPTLVSDYYRRCAILVQAIAQGLQAAHDVGVIHRDLKPQNILLDARDTPRVLDFGLARIQDDTVLSRSGDVAGTYQYMSPEQVAGVRAEIDHRTDIFSLGVVLYELLTLQRPFTGDTTRQIVAQIALYDPPEADVLRAQCPRDLAVIAAKAMQKRPSARYASMKELAADLERHLKNEPIHAKPATRVEQARKWMLRHPSASVGLCVGGTALLAISGLLVQQMQTASALTGANRALEASNVDLAAQKRRAEENATAAQLARDEATAKANDVLSLSAQHDHDDLRAEAARLWPAH
ncbi:MAG: serine/threonine protein kinase, partial [Planctomycetes bacterium]|nr:serine/threonine protein kinase [Planctomycetota bacterium]